MAAPMKYSLLLIVLTLLLFSCAEKSHIVLDNQVIIELNKDWQFKQVNDTSWIEAKVPGTVHTDLLVNNIIDDPFYRLNEKQLQWIDKNDWEYKNKAENDHQQV